MNQNSTPTTFGEINPNMTVLEWLRASQLVGTKEGCASGDCGACTAVVGELTINDNIKVVEYKSINTCIALAFSLIGKHLITVEGLKEGEVLHPVQKAMVIENGSQCGFCTPGFVMSMFAMYHNEDTVSLPKINEALSGNLCRCTGYKPIIAAAFSVFNEENEKPLDYYQKNQEKIIKSLISINDNENISLIFKGDKNNLSYDAPSNADELANILINNDSAKIVAAGTDLNLEITQSLKEFSHIVSVNGVKELQVINDGEFELEIGSAVSYQKATSSLVKYWPDLEAYLHRFASLPIKNWATIGGNIANASPIGDMPPVLIALEAKLKLRKESKVRIIALEDFFVTYKKTVLEKGEFIESIIIPKPDKNEHLIAHKISKRFEDDISAVCMAINVRLNDDLPSSLKIALGGMSGIPQRALGLEKVVLDNWNDENIAQLAYGAIKNEFSPLNDVRASSEYRLKVSANLVKKSILILKGAAVENLAEINQSNYL
ncbi:MAG: xanthine dehydrogenase small subunit [Candidatus Pseudothioglobus sp.]